MDNEESDIFDLLSSNIFLPHRNDTSPRELKIKSVWDEKPFNAVKVANKLFVAVYLYHMSSDFVLTKVLVDFSILERYLDADMICNIYTKYDAFNYGQLLGMCTDHASENMSVTKLLKTTSYCCLFHKLHLVVGSVSEYHGVVVKWIIEAMSFMHSSYDRLCYIMNEDDKSPVRFANTRWCSLFQVIMYFLHNRLEICSLLVKEGIEFIYETEIAVLEELALLLAVINDARSDLLNVDFEKIEAK